MTNPTPDAALLKEIVSEAGSGFVSVTFHKADGSERQLTFNPKHIGPVKGTGTKCQDPNIFRVMDIKLNQWRSFDARRVIKITVSGQTTTMEASK